MYSRHEFKKKNNKKQLNVDCLQISQNLQLGRTVIVYGNVGCRWVQNGDLGGQNKGFG